jgi:hypothetical protein
MNSIRGTVCLIGVKEKIDKEMGTVCSHRHADNLLKAVPSELDISVCNFITLMTCDFCEISSLSKLVFCK